GDMALFARHGVPVEPRERRSDDEQRQWRKTEGGEAEHHQDRAEIERMADEGIGAGGSKLLLLLERPGGPGADEQAAENQHFANGNEWIGPVGYVAGVAVEDEAVE